MNQLSRAGTRSIFSVLSVLVLCLLAAVPAFGQAETAQLTVKVTDPAGAVISGATVTVKSITTGATRTATSGDDGLAVVTNLRPGQYDVTVNAQGFAAQTKPAELTVGARLQVSVSMSAQAIQEAVTVVAGQGGVEVNTQSQELSNVVSSKQLSELPTLTRNPYDFVQLSGNIASDPEGSTSRGAGFSINGQRAASTDILLDGGENVDYFVAGIGQQVPLDSVQEFRVITSDFTAEYGRATGGIVNLTTKSGTNQFHGSVYEYNRVSALASNSFFDNANGIPKGVFTRNQFGYSFGGPIIKDKLFFFSSTEWTRIRSSQGVINIVPTSNLIAASSPNTQAFFNAFKLQTPINGTVYTVGQVVQSLGLPSSNAFAQLPANMPAFGKVVYSLPSDQGAGNPQNAYSTNNRIDWNISANTQLYGRYALQSDNLFNGSVGSSPYQGFNTGETDFNQNYQINLTHTFSSRLVSQTKFVYNRLNDQQPLGTQPVVPTLYITGGSFPTIEGAFVAFPGYLPFTPGNGIPFGGPQNVGQINQDVSYLRGNHQLRFGGQVVYIQDNRVFGAYEEANEQLGSNIAQGLANFVNGQLRVFQAAVYPQGKYPGATLNLPVGQPSFTRSNRYKEAAGYVMDTWHVKPRLTLDLGLRYEYYGVQHNNDPNLDSNFYLGSGSNIYQQIRNGTIQIAKNSPVGGLWGPSTHNFAPRLGFAWDVFGDGKMSVRGGYGIAYERNFGNVTFNVIQNPPNYAVIALTAGVDVPTIPVTLSNSGPLAGSGGTKVLPGTSLRAVNPNIKQAYSHIYSASVQRQFKGRTLVSVEYSGSTGVNLYSIANINRVASGPVYLGGGSTNPITGAPSSRLNGQYTSINFRGSDAKSRYNGVTFSVENSGLADLGLRFTARYTVSAARDDSSSTFSESGNDFNLGYLDAFNPSLDYGYSNFDTRNRFVGSFTWDVPFGKSLNRVEGQLLRGWTFSGIFTASTGTPFSVWDCTNAVEVCTRLIPGSGGSVAFSGSGHYAEDPSGTPDHVQFIDLSHTNYVAYANAISGTSSFGPYPSNMTARNAFRGPGQWNLDSAIAKSFQLTERFKLQFRGEFYNMFNHANLFINGSELDMSSGINFVPAHWDGRRNIQLALRLQF